MSDNQMQDPFSFNMGRNRGGGHVASIELADLAERRDDILLLAADLGRGPLGGLFIQRHPQRFVDLGIAEANSMSVAAGLAACGFIPYVIEMACFGALKCAEQIRTDLAYTRMPVRILGALPGLAMGYFGTSHHAVEDIAVTRSITGLTVVSACDSNATRALLRSTVDLPGPIYFRLPQGSETAVYPQPPRIEHGRFIRLREGTAATIIATGIGVQAAMGAAALLAAEGIEAAVLDAVFLKPIDEAAIVDAARASGRVLTVEEHNVAGGLGTAVGEVLARHGVPARLSIHGLPDQDLEVGTPADLYEYYKLTPAGVSARVKELLAS
jgi:transketolase